MALNAMSVSIPSDLNLDESQGLVRSYIDGVLVDLLHQLTQSPSEGQPSITLRCRPRAATCAINPRNGALETGRNDLAYRSFSWPGRTAYESWKFSM